MNILIIILAALAIGGIILLGVRGFLQGLHGDESGSGSGTWDGGGGDGGGGDGGGGDGGGGD